MEFLNPERTLATYEAHGGEHCFLRWAIETITPEQPGFSSATTDKHITETVFVAAEDAVLAGLLIGSRGGWANLADLLAANGIAFRFPASPARTTQPVRVAHPTPAGAAAAFLRRVA